MDAVRKFREEREWHKNQTLVKTGIAVGGLVLALIVWGALVGF